jgi:hypothetical protein
MKFNPGNCALHAPPCALPPRRATWVMPVASGTRPPTSPPPPRRSHRCLRRASSAVSSSRRKSRKAHFTAPSRFVGHRAPPPPTAYPRWSCPAARTSSWGGLTEPGPLWHSRAQLTLAACAAARGGRSCPPRCRMTCRRSTTCVAITVAPSAMVLQGRGGGGSRAGGVNVAASDALRRCAGWVSGAGGDNNLPSRFAQSPAVASACFLALC